MKCIVVRQPWAYLLVHGRKSIETRRTNIRHRGPLLIAASGVWTPENEAVCLTEPYASALGLNPRTGPITYDLRQSGIIGAVNLVDSMPVASLQPALQIMALCDMQAVPLSIPNGLMLLRREEFAFGDFRGGRWAWVCTTPKALKKPIPIAVMPGMFDVPDSLIPIDLRELPDESGE